VRWTTFSNGNPVREMRGGIILAQIIYSSIWGPKILWTGSRVIIDHLMHTAYNTGKPFVCAGKQLRGRSNTLTIIYLIWFNTFVWGNCCKPDGRRWKC